MQKLYATLFSLAEVTRNRVREEKGATAVEYGLLVGLIAVAIIVTVGLLGTKLDDLFTSIKDALPGGAAPAAADAGSDPRLFGAAAPVRGAAAPSHTGRR